MTQCAHQIINTRRPHTRHNRQFAVADSTYPSVIPLGYTGSLGNAPYECAGTLIDTQHILTAAHCFDRASTGLPRVSGSTWTRSASGDFQVQVNGVVHDVLKVYRNPCFSFDQDGPNSADLAVIELESAVAASTATPSTRYSGDSEVGQTITIVGWGDSGPSSNAGECTSNCDQLYRGENVVARFTGNTLVYTFDAPGDGALDLEAIAWSRDSGRPAFMTIGSSEVLVGVNSGGYCCSYSNKDQYVHVGSRLSSEWIDGSINASQGVVPDDCDEYGWSADEDGDDDTAAIIGGVVGGLAVLAIIVAVISRWAR